MSCCWEGGFGDQSEAEREAAWEPPAQPDGWRGELHLEDWPQHLAGPMYWMHWALDRRKVP